LITGYEKGFNNMRVTCTFGFMLSHIPASNTWSSESLIFPLIDILHKKQTQKKKNDNQKGLNLPL